MIRKHKIRTFLLALAVLLIAFRLYLPILARDYVNKELNKDPLYAGSVDSVRIHLWRGAYTLVDLVIERVEGQKKFPLIAADTIDIGVSWHELFNRVVVAKVHAVNVNINIVEEKKQEDGKEKKVIAVGSKNKGTQKKEVQTWQQTIDNLIPLKIGTAILTNGEIHFRDLTSNPKINIFLDQMHAEGHNLTNSKKISKSLFGTIEMRARAMKSGDLKVHIYLDPLSTPLQMKLETNLTHLNLVELNNFFTAYGKFDVKKGQFNLYSETATADNKIEGYIKPIIKDLQVSDFAKDREKGLGHAIWEKIVGALGGILKNHHEDQQAAKIPFSGKLGDAKVDTWATVWSVLENMFVKALEPKIDHSVKLSDVEKKDSKK